MTKKIISTQLLNLILIIAIASTWISVGFVGEYGNFAGMGVSLAMFFIEAAIWLLYVIERKKVIKYNNELWSEKDLVEIITSKDVIKTKISHYSRQKDLDINTISINLDGFKEKPI